MSEQLPLPPAPKPPRSVAHGDTPLASSPSANEAPTSSGPFHDGSVLEGVAMVIAGHLLHVFVPAATLAIGITQLVYGVPMLIFSSHKSQTTAGIWIAMAVTFLLNAACFGVFFVIALRNNY